MATHSERLGPGTVLIIAGLLLSLWDVCVCIHSEPFVPIVLSRTMGALPGEPCGVIKDFILEGVHKTQRIVHHQRPKQTMFLNAEYTEKFLSSESTSSPEWINETFFTKFSQVVDPDPHIENRVSWGDYGFYNFAITGPFVCARIMVEMGSHRS